MDNEQLRYTLAEVEDGIDEHTSLDADLCAVAIDTLDNYDDPHEIRIAADDLDALIDRLTEQAEMATSYALQLRNAQREMEQLVYELDEAAAEADAERREEAKYDREEW